MSLSRRSSFSLLLPVLTLALLLAATVVGYYGTRAETAAIIESGSTDPADTETALTAAWPHDEPEAPLGPHREQFQSSCIVCHSTRLVLTQPRFPESKWKEIVHKMVATYGAPLSPAQEQNVVAYLTATHGR